MGRPWYRSLNGVNARSDEKTITTGGTGDVSGAPGSTSAITFLNCSRLRATRWMAPSDASPMKRKFWERSRVHVAAEAGCTATPASISVTRPRRIPDASLAPTSIRVAPIGLTLARIAFVRRCQ
jgi:hypothetical protein